MTDQFLTYTQRILQERQLHYGPPEENLVRIAKRWSLTLGQEITPQQVALCMMDVKLARLSHDPEHRDSIMDVAGYAACLNEINRHQEEQDL
jgi:hypothetical protein